MPGPLSFVALKRRRPLATYLRGGGWSLCLLAWLCAGPVFGQQQTPDQPYVLHVYTNLMQVAALVLDTSDRPFKHIDPSRLSITLGDSPAFRPAYVRLEGDDPISLSIVLDLSGEINDILPALRQAIPSLAPDDLHPKDRVSIYALDCNLVRTAEDMPANRATISRAIDYAVNEPALHDSQEKAGGCSKRLSLVDALALVARPLSTLPGRRVLLVFSNGHDTRKWSQLRQFAATESISVFGAFNSGSWFSPTLDMDYPGNERGGGEGGRGTEGGGIDYTDSFLGSLCTLTGGLLLPVHSDRSVAKALPELVEMIRGRYILEFHRPKDAKAGHYNIRVNLDHAYAHIHVGGTSVQTASAAELAPPEITPSDAKTDAPAEPPPSSPPATTPQ